MTAPSLRWHELAADSQEWQPLHPAPAENRGFTERGRYAFEKPATGWSLCVDDEPLADAMGGPARWLWEPGFFAGEVTAELVGPGENNRTLFLLDVAPDASKLGRDTFGRMVEELWREDPELVVGSEPATIRIGELGAYEDPWLAFARLRRYCPDFVRAITLIRANPRRALLVRRASTPLHQARRVDRQTAASLVRSPAVAVLTDGTDAEPTFAADSRLDVPLVEETVDSAANRAMLALLLALIRRATTLTGRLQSLVDGEQDSETRTLLSSRWPARRRILEDIAAELKILSRRSPFVDVRRPEVTAAGLTAVAADHVYARAWGRGWRALRRGVESGETAERLWVSPSWEIYERWCFVRLAKMLRAAAPEWQWTRRSDRWVGGFAGRRAELILQPTFRSRDAEVPGMWSVSKERVPDLVLRVDSTEGTRFVVLDAKYRASRSNVLDAMESAHIYQDSLRIGPRRPDAALLLMPAGGGAKWLESPAFQSKHRVGVHVLSPGTDTAVPRLMTEALSV
jgi:hypothetical protein